MFLQFPLNLGYIIIYFWKTVIQFAISIMTVALTAISTTSCMGLYLCKSTMPSLICCKKMRYYDRLFRKFLYVYG